MNAAAPLLELRQVSRHFGGLTAVSGLDLAVPPGLLLGLIGPNGAGKTTVFNLLSGLYTPSQGEILFAGLSLTGLPPHQIARAGLARTFQNIRLFGSRTVWENVRVAQAPRQTYAPWESLLHTRRFRTEEAASAAEAERLLQLFNLWRLRDQPAGSLPYGEQRKLEIVRALATQPRLLLLDEPAAGMNPAEKQELVRLIQRIHTEFSLTLLLVEHSMRVVMGLCQRIVVLDHGTKIAEGTPTEIQNNPRVIEAYLGEDHGNSLHHH